MALRINEEGFGLSRRHSIEPVPWLTAPIGRGSGDRAGLISVRPRFQAHIGLAHIWSPNFATDGIKAQLFSLVPNKDAFGTELLISTYVPCT